MVASMLDWLGGGEAGTDMPSAQGSSATGEGAWASGGGSAFDGQGVGVPLHTMGAPATLPRPYQISLGSHAARPTTSALPMSTPPVPPPAPPAYGASTNPSPLPPPSAQYSAAPCMAPCMPPPTHTLQLSTGAGDRAPPSPAAFQGSASVPHCATVPVIGLATMGAPTATLPPGPPPPYTNTAQGPPPSSAPLLVTNIPMASAPPSSTEPAPPSSAPRAPMLPPPTAPRTAIGMPLSLETQVPSTHQAMAVSTSRAPPPPPSYAPPTAGGSVQLAMGGGTTRTGSGSRSPPRRAATMGDHPATVSAGQVSTSGARIQRLFDTLTAVLTYP